MRQLTDLQGVIRYNINYDPYGQPIEQFGSLQSNLGYMGEYTDPNGLLYLRARYYNLNVPHP